MKMLECENVKIGDKVTYKTRGFNAVGAVANIYHQILPTERYVFRLESPVFGSWFANPKDIAAA